MVQDFAKIKPESVLDPRPVEAPPSWMLLFTGLITGVAVGVFACVLFYLSGNVPPLQVPPQTRAIAENAAATVVTETAPLNEEVPDPEEMQLEFYEELQNYEVKVDATPVEIESRPAVVNPPATESRPEVEIESRPARLAVNNSGYMLQSGAYEQQASANSQRARLQSLGLNTVVKQQSFPGRTLYLVQSGPFNQGEELNNAENLLQRNNISNIKIGLK